MISILKCPSIYLLKSLCASRRFQKRRAGPTLSIEKCKLRRGGWGGAAKGHTTGVEPRIPTGMHIGDEGGHTKGLVPGLWSPGDLDL